jgi:hypothetical protein
MLLKKPTEDVLNAHVCIHILLICDEARNAERPSVFTS